MTSYWNIIEKRLTIVNFFSIYVLVQRLLNYYPKYPTRRFSFGEFETPYRTGVQDDTDAVCDIILKEIFVAGFLDIRIFSKPSVSNAFGITFTLLPCFCNGNKVKATYFVLQYIHINHLLIT